MGYHVYTKVPRQAEACSAWENGVVRGLDGNEYREVRKKLTRGLLCLNQVLTLAYLYGLLSSSLLYNSALGSLCPSLVFF